MDEETWPSSTQSTNTQPRVETTSHYAGDDEYGTIPKAPGFHEGLAFQERDFPADGIANSKFFGAQRLLANF